MQMRTLTQVTKELGCSHQTVRSWLDRGLVPQGSKVGNMRLFDEEEVSQIRAYSKSRKPWERYANRIIEECGEDPIKKEGT